MNKPTCRLLPELSKREQQIAKQAVSGLTYKQIASALFISPETVRNHLRRIYRKLGINSKAELIHRLLDHGDQAEAMENPPADSELPDRALTPKSVDSGQSLDPQNSYRTERRPLTVLHCKLVGAETLLLQLDPEELHAALHGFYKICDEVAGRYDGFFAERSHNDLQFYFGYPQAQEDAAQRAVRTGMAMLEVIHKLPQLEITQPTNLSLQIGIASGVVVVEHDITSGGEHKQIAFGAIPKLSERLADISAPGTVFIHETTRRLCADSFSYRPLDPQSLTDITDPVDIWQVISRIELNNRFTARTQLILPLIGRESELRLLLDRWTQAQLGEGQGVLLIGEAGIGKSRIAHALVDTLVDQSYLCIEYQCLPYYTDSALYPAIQQLLQAADIHDGESDASKLAKLEAMFSQSNNMKNDIALIGYSLGIETAPDYLLPDLTPQQLRAHSLKVFINRVVGLSQQQPLLLLIEDIHWIDPTTLELVELLLERVMTERILVLLTARPNLQHKLEIYPHVTRLTLNRLGRQASLSIINQLTAEKTLPEEIVDLIATKADGIPLFVEELTKSVIESGVMQKEMQTFEPGQSRSPLDIPASLHDSLLARLDRLPVAKATAQIAACIGREFNYKLLAEVSRLEELELQTAIEELIRAGLLFRRGSTFEASFLFKHALIRDAAYDSLLKQQRKQIHADIVHVLEQQYPEQVNEFPEIVAKHCANAGLINQAVDYSYRAGQRLLERSAMAEALNELQQSLHWLLQLENNEARQRREIDIRLAIGSAQIAVKGYANPETGDTFERVSKLCEQVKDKQNLVTALYGQTLYHMDAGRHRKALEIASRLLDTAGNNLTGLLIGHRLVGTCKKHLGSWGEAVFHLERAVNIYIEKQHDGLKSIYAQDQLATSLALLAMALVVRGFPDQAKARIEAAIYRARELEHAHTLAFVLHSAAFVKQRLRDVDGLMSICKELITLADKFGFPYHKAAGLSGLGTSLVMSGKVSEGISKLSHGITEQRSAGARYLIPYWLAELAAAKSLNHEYNEAIEIIEEALKLINETEEQGPQPLLYNLKGTLCLMQAPDEFKVAEDYMKKAIMQAHQQEAKWWELRSAISLTKLWIDQGKPQNAYNLLKPIYEGFSEGFDTTDLQEAETLIVQLEETAPVPFNSNNT